MYTLSKITGVIMLFCVLTACQTSQTTTDTNNYTDKKLRASRINTQLGLAYLQRHELERAKQKLVLALEQGPTLPEGWYTMGYFMEMTGNVSQAKQDYLKAIALAPARGDTNNNYGTFLCRHGEYQAAIHHFMSAVNDPKYLSPASAYENAGLCSLKIPNIVEAEQFFHKALTEDPNRTAAIIELAEINYKQGKYNQAQKLLGRFVALSHPTQQSSLLMEKVAQKL